MTDRLGYYAGYAWRFVVMRDAGPLICGLAITDRCNLSCRACHVSNNGVGDMPFSEASSLMRSAYSRGCRELYFSGGEPMLWRDGDRTVDDLIAEARSIGYFHVHLYTNGTLGLSSAADLSWVSVDGLAETYALRRGDHFDEVVDAIRKPGNPPTAIIYVIDRFSAEGVEPFLAWVRDSRLPVRGVMIYFHTPYYGKDELYLDADERAVVIDRLLDYKRRRLPLLNSTAGLKALRSGKWPRRMPVALVIDSDGESVCCRASDDVCPDCGYGACTELSEAQRLKPSAVWGMVGYV
jgi:MoaA/NifB/PqqE/SkfB family radical SAM enzyme